MSLYLKILESFGDFLFLWFVWHNDCPFQFRGNIKVMNKFKFLVFTGFFIFAFSTSFTIQAQTRADYALINQAEHISGDHFSIFSQTRKGALIYSVNRPSSQMLNAIDTGLSDLFGWREKTDTAAG